MSEPVHTRPPIDLHLAVTATVIVAATWVREGRKVEKQFILPLHVRGKGNEILEALDATLVERLGDVMQQIESAVQSSERGYMSRFGKMTPLEEPSLAKPCAAPVHIPPPSAENVAKIAAMIAEQQG
jgi:hypothetical protein